MSRSVKQTTKDERPGRSVPGARRRRVRARATVEIAGLDRISNLRHPDHGYDRPSSPLLEALRPGAPLPAQTVSPASILWRQKEGHESPDKPGRHPPDFRL